jgi:hypothetical protein
VVDDPISWCETSDAHFPRAARVDGQWWVLRVNSFPDHPLYTLFVDGVRDHDLDDLPPAWASRGADLDWLGESDSLAALAGVIEFRAYGSESGDPCDNPLCCG